MLLIVRLMDELKDKEIDRVLFGDRPLPSGRVRESDIVISLVGAIALYVVANLWSGAAFSVALFVLGYALLMFRHFFLPELHHRSLLLTVATHSPLFPILITYGFSVFAVQHGLDIVGREWGLIATFAAMIWSTALGWEVARKIRIRARENNYTTYSRLFGRRGAIVVCAAFQATALGIGAYLDTRFSLPWTYMAVLGAGFCVVASSNLWFLVAPEKGVRVLRPAAEIYIFVTLIAQVVGFADPSWWEFVQ